MPLLPSPRHRPADLRAWSSVSAMDRIEPPGFRGRLREAQLAVSDFLAGGPAYVGVSWGKDSVVVADLVLRMEPEVPLLKCIVQPVDNPENAAVRDAFLAIHPTARLYESEVWCSLDDRGWHQRGTLQAAFAAFEGASGIDRYISGVRAEESAIRLLAVFRHGMVGERTCRPLAHWTSRDVFHYIHTNGLPLHPNYAMSMGGHHERGRLRVASLSGKAGREMGRLQIEKHYYREEMAAIERGDLPHHLAGAVPQEHPMVRLCHR